MKKIFTFAVLLLLSVSFALPAFRKGAEISLSRNRNATWSISVSWPTEQPKLTFKAPNGTVYDPLSEKEGTLTVVNEKSMYYVIKNAPEGSGTLISISSEMTPLRSVCSIIRMPRS